MTLFDDEPRSFGVGELADWLREVVQSRFADEVWVHGEIRNLNRSRAGHVYFDLVEPSAPAGRAPAALLSVVLFNSTREVVNRQLMRAGGAVRMTDGVQVKVRAAVDFYPPSGRLQLKMSGIDPTYTLGLLTSERDLVLRALAADGLLEANRRLPVPALPVRIGLVTRSGSAACADFLQELAASAIGFEVVVVDTAVQGDHASWSVAASIRTAERHQVDLIAVVRGGGARTDLVAFDSEVVARTIATRSVPVLTGIGHEVDSTVADEVAHSSLKTPTACAGQIVALARAYADAVDRCWSHAVGRADALLAEHDARVRHTAQATVRATSDALRLADLRTAGAATSARHTALRQLERRTAAVDRVRLGVTSAGRSRLADQRATVHALAGRAAGAGRRAGTTASHRVDLLAERTRLLDPATTLARGWSITRTADGRLIRRRDDVGPGTALRITVADGDIAATTRSSPVDPAPTRPEERQ